MHQQVRCPVNEATRQDSVNDAGCKGDQDQQHGWHRQHADGVGNLFRSRGEFGRIADLLSLVSAHFECPWLLMANYPASQGTVRTCNRHGDRAKF